MAGVRARSEDDVTASWRSMASPFDLPLAATIGGALRSQDGPMLHAPGPLAAPTLGGGLTSLASGVPRDAGGAPVGITLGVGAQLAFTATLGGSTWFGSQSAIAFNNQSRLSLGPFVGTQSARAVLQITEQTQSTASLVATTFWLNNGSPYSISAPADVAIDTSIFSPSDPLFATAWYANATYGTHADRVWQDYTGAGVTVAVYDNGIDYSHPDLVANLDVARGYNPYTGTRGPAAGDARLEDDVNGNAQGTVVAGLIAAARNTVGSVGVAHGATLYSIFNYDDASLPPEMPFDGRVQAFLDAALHADVMNNSWSDEAAFHARGDFGGLAAAQGAALEVAATEGRDGLGTIIVQAAGDGGSLYADTNMSNWTNSRFSIAVGASAGNGGQYTTSTKGASVLVSAPGGLMLSTDRVGSEGLSAGGYTDGYVYGSGTATAVVSGVVALVLEANPLLGARDVQEILAYSAQPSRATGDIFFNGAGNWNNGGLRLNSAVGAGIVDARAAVRLAETWDGQRTWNNVVEQSAAISPNETMTLHAPGSVSMTKTLRLEADQVIDRVDLKVDIKSEWIEFLTVTLTSPDGTTSTLLDRPGSFTGRNYTYLPHDGGQLVFTLNSTHFMGEHAAGDWTVTLTTMVADEPAFIVRNGAWADLGLTYPITTTFDGAELVVYGDAVDRNTTYFFTDAYVNAFHGTSLNDSDGGYDTVNAAATTQNVHLYFDGSAPSSIGGRELVNGLVGQLWRAYGGDGQDHLVGNATADGLAFTALYGMRGADHLVGRSRVALLSGGAGSDLLEGGGDLVLAEFDGAVADHAIAETGPSEWQVSRGGDTDTLVAIDWLKFSDGLFAVEDGQPLRRLTGTTYQLTLDPASGLGLAVDAAGFRAHAGALAPWAGEIASLVITDAAIVTLDVATLLGVAPLLPAVRGTSFALEDSAAAIDAAILDLAALGPALAAITFTDARGELFLTRAEHAAAGDLLARLEGDYNITVTAEDGSSEKQRYRGDATAQSIQYFDADGVITSETRFGGDLAAWERLERTYADGVLSREAFTGISGRPFDARTHTYNADGTLAATLFDGFAGFDTRLHTYADGVLTSITTTGLPGAAAAVTKRFDTEGNLIERSRLYEDRAHEVITTTYDSDGAVTQTRMEFADGTSRLTGTAGADRLSMDATVVLGRDGADRFVVGETGNGLARDFNRAEGDRIDLSAVFDTLEDMAFLGGGAFTGRAGELRFDTIDRSVLVSIDRDGDLLADVTFAVQGFRLLASDFVI